MTYRPKHLQARVPHSRLCFCILICYIHESKVDDSNVLLLLIIINRNYYIPQISTPTSVTYKMLYNRSLLGWLLIFSLSTLLKLNFFLLHLNNNSVKYRTALSLQPTPLATLLSRVSTLTRDIDIANLSVCPSVCLSVCLSVCPSVTFRYQMKTA